MSIAFRPKPLTRLLAIAHNSSRLGLVWIFCGSSFSILLYIFIRSLLFHTSMRTDQGINLLLWIVAAAVALTLTRLTLKHSDLPPASISVVAAIAGFLYFQTSSSWIYVNRDPGFLSTGSLLFWDAPLRQLSPVAFEGLKWPGFYSVDTGIAVQGFPGYYALASNEVFFTGTFPQFTSQLTSAAAVFWIGWLLWKLGKSNVWITLALQIALATSVPWLYVARNPFTESLAALIFLVGIFAVLMLATSKEGDSQALWGIYIIVVLSVANFTRIDGPVTTVLPLSIMIMALYIKDKWRDSRGLYVLVFGVLCSTVTLLLGRAFSPVYFMDLGKYANAELVLLLGFAVLAFGLGAIPLALAALRNFIRTSWFDIVARILPSLVFLVAPLSWLLRTSDDRFKSALMPLPTIISYLGIVIGLLFAVGYIVTSLRHKWLFDEYGWLLIGSVFVFSTYLQNPLVYGDEPWGSRRFVISTMILILLFAKLGIDFVLSNLRVNKVSHD